jgi:hypothetical protein
MHNGKRGFFWIILQIRGARMPEDFSRAGILRRKESLDKAGTARYKAVQIYLPCFEYIGQKIPFSVALESNSPTFNCLVRDFSAHETANCFRRRVCAKEPASGA